MSNPPVFGAGIWHFATYVDRYATEGYGPPVGLLEQIDKAGAVGDLSVVDLNWPFAGFDGTLDDVKAALQRNGLRAVAITPEIYNRDYVKGSITNPDPGVRKQALTLLNEATELAKQLGCDYVKLWFGQDGWDYPFQVDYHDIWQLAVGGLRELVSAHPDIKFVIEYKPREPRNRIIFPNAARTLLAIQQVGLDNLGILLDFGHSLYGLETPADAAQLCIDAGRLFAIDVNDNFRGWDDDMVVGSVHLVETFEFFHTLRKNNWDGVWQLDQFPFREDSVDAAKAAIRFLKAVHRALDALDEEALRAAQASHDALAAQRLVQQVLLSSMAGAKRRMTALAVEHVTMPVFGRLDPHASRAEQVAHIAEAARQIRIQDLKLVHYAGAGHIGGDLSAIDILATLYGAVLNVTPDTVDDPERDRFILSKGHVAGALYTTLAAFGFLPVEDLATFLKPLSALNGHPNRNKVRGVEANTGPLGHGLPIAVGHALSAKLDVSRRRTYVLVGDGELQEGSNWEAMMAASHYELDRLTVIVDRNRLQQGATVRETNDLDPLDEKAAAFGFAVVEVNGHDHGELLDVLSSMPFRPGKPTFVIAHTHKGHPISFMSNNAAWHHRVPSPDELQQALDELAPNRVDIEVHSMNPTSRRRSSRWPTSRGSTAATPTSTPSPTWPIPTTASSASSTTPSAPASSTPSRRRSRTG